MLQKLPGKRLQHLGMFVWFDQLHHSESLQWITECSISFTLTTLNVTNVCLKYGSSLQKPSCSLSSQAAQRIMTLDSYPVQYHLFLRHSKLQNAAQNTVPALGILIQFDQSVCTRNHDNGLLQCPILYILKTLNVIKDCLEYNSIFRNPYTV